MSAAFDDLNQTWNGRVSVDQLGIVWTESRPTQAEAIQAGVEWLTASQWKSLRWRTERVAAAVRPKKEAPPPVYGISRIVRACILAGTPREEIVNILRHLTGTPVDNVAFTNWAYSVVLSVMEDVSRR